MYIVYHIHVGLHVDHKFLLKKNLKMQKSKEAIPKKLWFNKNAILLGQKQLISNSNTFDTV